MPRSCSRVNHLSSIHASFDAILAAGIFYCLGPGLGRAGLGQDGSWWGGVRGREGSQILWVWHLIFGFVIQEETVCGFETMMCFVVVVVAQHVLKLLFLKDGILSASLFNLSFNSIHRRR